MDASQPIDDKFYQKLLSNGPSIVNGTGVHDTLTWNGTIKYSRIEVRVA